MGIIDTYLVRHLELNDADLGDWASTGPGQTVIFQNESCLIYGRCCQNPVARTKDASRVQMMTVDQDANLDRKIEQEIRQGRTFSLAEVIGQEASSFLKGDSPIPKLSQVKAELIAFIEQHLVDPPEALKVVLRELIEADDLPCSQHLNAPLNALSAFLQSLLDRDTLLHDFVRRVDMKWGQIYDEPPYFEQPGQPPHPDDEYTHASVREQLSELLAIVKLQRT